ncbi:MAG: thiamine pyrophosphate-binding protein [Chloroflexi bacterium]|nr:thiamine pyrophosphate-binding protein [Chloroflexota bacterium]MDA1175260.1 thiamine pyrophosphate-binding protein [Chloroflexota bacterium]
MTISGAQAITRSLRLEGVDTIFTVAGDHILPLLDVLADEGFRLIDCRHEQAAVHMADAWGRITGRLGVTAVTTPGHANAIPGLANAMSTESPVLNISGSADMKNYSRGIMQEIDQINMAKPVTKGAWLVHEASRIPDFIALAARTCFEGRRGPTHLTIPVDVQSQLFDETSVSWPTTASTRRSSAALGAPDQITEAVRLLKAAQRPLIVASTPAAYGEWTDIYERFIETTKMPFMTEEAARGVVPDDHPYCFGFFDLSQHQTANLIREADCVLLLGKMLDFTIGYGLPPIIAADAKVIQVDPSAMQIGRNRGVDVGIVGDVGPIVAQLAEEAQKSSWDELPWVQRFRDLTASHTERMNAFVTDEVPLRSMRVHAVIAAQLRPDDVLVFDGGDYAYFGRATLPARAPRSWYYLPNLGMLGSAVPVAMAAKLAKPDSRVLCITGDGAFGFNAMEIDTAVRLGLNIVVVLGNDAAWGIDKNLQIGIYGKAVITDLAPSRYDIVAEGLGAYGELVEQPEDIAPALERALAAGRPALLNILVQSQISPRAQAVVDSRKSQGAF